MSGGLHVGASYVSMFAYDCDFHTEDRDWHIDRVLSDILSDQSIANVEAVAPAHSVSMVHIAALKGSKTVYKNISLSDRALLVEEAFRSFNDYRFDRSGANSRNLLFTNLTAEDKPKDRMYMASRGQGSAHLAGTAAGAVHASPDCHDGQRLLLRIATMLY
jgi:hypothetical protein